MAAMLIVVIKCMILIGLVLAPVPAECSCSAHAAPGESIARLQYAYDLMGNRIEAVRTPRLMAVQTEERQEQANQYDAFNRLTQWLAKDVDGQSQHLFLHRQDVWALDLLGNSKARSSTFGAAPPEL